MSILKWDNIKKNIVKFISKWRHAEKERKISQIYWLEFFQAFGIPIEKIGVFEKHVKLYGKKSGYIDLFWKGLLIIEQKSKGKDLNSAYKQATNYIYGLKNDELPKYIIVCNFTKLRLYNLIENDFNEFYVNDLYNNLEYFDFIRQGKPVHIRQYNDPVINYKGARLLANLHETLYNDGYTGHTLEILFIQLLYCFFADNSDIFPKKMFLDYLVNYTNIDGSDLGSSLNEIFQILNKPKNKRMKTINSELNKFPYINGELYSEIIEIPKFNKESRDLLLKACKFDWSQISPTIFGTMFQSAMNKEHQRSFGSHYTSEDNILKVIKSLFLDDLYSEYENIGYNKKKLEEFHKKISNIKILDPACGCGNFLIVSYRELRLLELKILKNIFGITPNIDLGVELFLKVNINQFYGLEIDELPAKIAKVALWITDHQMNKYFQNIFGKYYARIPLKISPTIINCNSLQYNWNELISKKQINYIIGNPPFVGKQHRSFEQNKDMKTIFTNVKSAGVLDYVTSWFIKSAEYISNTKIKVGFVATNSISQGEQVGILWNTLFEKYQIKIHFAHSTFKWNTKAENKANVYVVIIGFANFNIKNKYLFEYIKVNLDPTKRGVSNISPYLCEGDDFILQKRNKPICSVPEISFGNMPNDGGFLILSDEEKNNIIKKEPFVKKYIKPLICAKEYLHNKKRWCIWLVDVPPNEINKSKEFLFRIEKVKEIRNKSNRESTKNLAEFPTLFGEIRQKNNDYILIPIHTSENRKYIPFGFFNKDNIVHNSCLFIPKADLYIFGVISSIMYMVWIKYTCGRLEGRFRFSGKIVYNNYPWVKNPNKKKKEIVKIKVQNILDIRNEMKKSSLAVLYSSHSLYPKLIKAHQELDKAVDLCYRLKTFLNETERIEFLFNLYTKYTK